MKFDLNSLKACGFDVWLAETVIIRRPHLVELGNHIAIDTGFYITTAAKFGDHIHIAPYVSVIGGENGYLKMGNFTNISVGGRIICGSDRFLGEGLITAPGIPEEFRDSLKVEPIVFEDFANVGASVTILPGVKLAEGSVVGAGALVKEDTEPWTIYAGIPAKPIKARPKDKMIEFAKKLGY
jgi:dTDP-4-amino-4,6-dideoxy-D-glucose acyltransferase